MARLVVDVMPKPEILDPQGKAVTGALLRLGFAGLSVRQGKRFEVEVEGDATSERLDEVRRAAETLLANTVIETFDVRVETDPADGAAGDGADDTDHDDTDHDDTDHDDTDHDDTDHGEHAAPAEQQG